MFGSGPGNISKKQVLFVHSGGTQGLHEGSSDLVAWMKLALGGSYEVICPAMPRPDQPEYENWKKVIRQSMTDIDDGVILVGHSLGGSVITKYLSEERISKKIDGLLLVGSPFWGKRNWQVNEFILKKDFAACLPAMQGVFLYHSLRDLVVPFQHLTYYAEKLPMATIRAINNDEHLFSAGLPEIACDIKSLHSIEN